MFFPARGETWTTSESDAHFTVGVEVYDEALGLFLVERFDLIDVAWEVDFESSMYEEDHRTGVGWWETEVRVLTGVDALCSEVEEQEREATGRRVTVVDPMELLFEVRAAVLARAYDDPSRRAA